MESASGKSELSAKASPLETAALMFKQMRPKQWVKNLIVYAPLLFVGRFDEPHSLILSTGAFGAFCLVSSGIYVLNDAVDVEADRIHPTKKNRPIASGRLNLKFACAVGIFSLLGGLALAFAVRPTMLIACLAYVVLNVLYSLKLKNTPIIDVFCIASGFVIRAIAGALAIKVAASPWFLLCTTLGALFLAVEKRRQELKLMDSKSHRKVLSDYTLQVLGRMENVIVPCLLTSYALYSFNSPHGEWMMSTVPIVLYGVLRYLMLSEHGNETGTPEDVFWRDRPIQITIILWVITCAFVIYCKPAELVHHFGEMIDAIHL